MTLINGNSSSNEVVEICDTQPGIVANYRGAKSPLRGEAEVGRLERLNVEGMS